jgi:hypothetical protein
MSDLDFLVHRYLEDRQTLEAEELDTLIAGLRADPELAITLREQLMLDDLLAQRAALDRRHFLAQVEQRVADLKQPHDSFDKQVADLKSLAAAERVADKSSGWNSLWGGWAKYALAVSLVGAVATVAMTSRLWRHHGPAIAKVTAIEGEVTISHDGETEAAEVSGSLESGQKVVVPQGGRLSLSYEDGTELTLKGDTEIALGAEEQGGRKQIHIDHGELIAHIKPQQVGPVRFTTPHAAATAPAAVLRLVVTDENTLLDVSEGKAQFDRLTDKRSIMVAATESGMASRDTLQIRQLTWPDRRDGLAYLFSPLETTKDEKPLTVSRSPETRRLSFTSLEPRGAATLGESRLFYELNGGNLYSDAGRDISTICRGGSELTLEAVFSPANLDQSGPARILALADESDSPDFSLGQEGADVTFSLRTDASEPLASPPRLPITSADSPLHLTVTYRNGELIAYRDGTEIARWKEPLGSLGAWKSGPLTVGADASGEHPWRGILEAFALYNRCLEPGEVARNARNYRLLAGRGME